MVDGTSDARLDEIWAKLTAVQENQAVMLEKQDVNIQILTESMQEFRIGRQIRDAKVEQFLWQNQKLVAAKPPPSSLFNPKFSPIWGDSKSGHHNQIKTLRLEAPRFSGENPSSWISRMQRYFDFYNTPDPQRLIIASFYLDGNALDWYEWRNKNQLISCWKEFLTALEMRFGFSPSSLGADHFTKGNDIASEATSETLLGGLAEMGSLESDDLNEMNSQTEYLEQQISEHIPEFDTVDEIIDQEKMGSFAIGLCGAAKLMSCGDEIYRYEGVQSMEDELMKNHEFSFGTQLFSWNKFSTFDANYSSNFSEIKLLASPQKVDSNNKIFLDKDEHRRPKDMGTNVERQWINQTRLVSDDEYIELEPTRVCTTDFHQESFCYEFKDTRKLIQRYSGRKALHEGYTPFKQIRRDRRLHEAETGDNTWRNQLLVQWKRLPVLVQCERLICNSSGLVAYKLPLLDHSKLHPIFHLFVLKICPIQRLLQHRQFLRFLWIINLCFFHWLFFVPDRLKGLILGFRSCWFYGKVYREDFSIFKAAYPEFHLEDKVFLHGVGNDTIGSRKVAEKKRSQRSKARPKKLEGYVTSFYR